MARIFQIGHHGQGAESGGQCRCGAARARQELFSRELADLESERCNRHILRLEDLQNCFPKGAQRRSPQWDYIYSGGLLATLPQIAARQVLKKATSCLKPGGRLLFANIAFDPREPACRACGRGIYRTEYGMTDLARAVPDETVSGQAVFRDASGMNVYLELHRR